MPLTRISLKRGKPRAYREAIAESIYQAMRETFTVPEHDKFMIVTEHDDGDFIYGAKYLDIARGDGLVIIQITVSNTRTLEQKKALFKRITERLAESPGVRPEDVFINLLEVVKENWSFGNGVAQYA
jgi:phenylpyruvate tautomerase PptA (4-oxalocrotonate tautomerase family)